MFLRKQLKKGNYYYSLVETYRDGGKVKHRTFSLGREGKLHYLDHKLELAGFKGRITPDKAKEISLMYPELEQKYQLYLKSEDMKEGRGRFCAYREILPPTWKHNYKECSNTAVLCLFEPEFSLWTGNFNAKKGNYCLIHYEGQYKAMLRRRKQRIRREQREDAEFMENMRLTGIVLNKDESFSILELPEDSTLSEVKAQYKKLAKQYHPDRGGDEEKFKKISSAYNQALKSFVN